MRTQTTTTATPSTRTRLARRVLGAALLVSAVAAMVGAGSPQAATNAGADLAIVDVSGERAAVGSPYTFAYEAANWGPGEAAGVELTAALSGSFSFESASFDGGTCAYAPATRTVACDIAGLAENASATVEIVVTPSGDVSSAADVSSAQGGDPDTANNHADSSPELLPAGAADLWVYPNSGIGDEGVGSGGYAVAGEPFEYSIDVVNYGPAVAEDVTLSLVLPIGVAFESSADDCSAFEDDSGTFVTCLLGALERARTVHVTAVAPLGMAGQTLRTEVFVDGGGLDPGPAPNGGTNQLAVVSGLSAEDARSGEGTRFVRVPVVLSDPVSDTVTVGYATSNGTAKAGKDYKAARGTLTFAPGETRQLVSIPVLQDRRSEKNESFVLSLSNVGGPASAAAVLPSTPTAVLVRPRGTATILDDDPKIRIANARVLERDAGVQKVTFRITLSHASPTPVTARFATADESARAGSDYVARRSSIRFRPGQRTKTVTVRIKSDRVQEGTERFLGKLSRVRGAVVADRKATATIVDDD
jgi:uncharacterized repeat protein (TIGR01451 family)